MRFRKTITLLPGIRLNVTAKGITSMSVGVPGATLNIGKGAMWTSSAPGTGLSHSFRKKPLEPIFRDFLDKLST